MNKTTVYLIRHGEIDNPRNLMYGGTLDLLLNNKGRSQMLNLGEFLQREGVQPSAIYTSHLSRAKESGQILARIFGTVVIEDERLGDNKIPQFAGLTQEEKEIRFPERDEFDPTLQGHESKEQVLTRMCKSFDDIIKANEGKTIFIIGHSDPLRLLLFSLHNPNEKEIPLLDRLPQLEKGYAWEVLIDQQGRMKEYELVQPNESSIKKEQES